MVDSIISLIGVVFTFAILFGHALYTLKDPTSTYDKMLNKGIELLFNENDDQTWFGRPVFALLAFIIFTYMLWYACSIIILSACALFILGFEWLVWFYGNIMAVMLLKDAKWTVPAYDWNKIKEDDLEYHIGTFDIKHYNGIKEVIREFNIIHRDVYRLTSKYNEKDEILLYSNLEAEQIRKHVDVIIARYNKRNNLPPEKKPIKKTAYEIAVENGFKGTPKDYLNSLIGVCGDGTI